MRGEKFFPDELSQNGTSTSNSLAVTQSFTTETRFHFSLGTVKGSYRKPRFHVKLERHFQSSWKYAANTCCVKVLCALLPGALISNPERTRSSRKDCTLSQVKVPK